MRPRTFIFVIIFFVLIAVAVVLFFALRSGGGLGSVLPGGGAAEEGPTGVTEVGEQEPGLPLPTATPAFRPVTVVVAKVRIPVGEPIRMDLLEMESRPDTNIALQGGYTFSDPEEIIGRITRVDIAPGQEILQPMLTINANDITNFGSDLALYVDQGKVAVAFPIDRFSGIAYAMRPGDMVDILMSLSFSKLDPEFNTPLPNLAERVNKIALANGEPFLFPATFEGRLELVEELGNAVVAQIGPGSTVFENQGEEAIGKQIPRRVTQLTVQQAEVLYVGTYRDPRELEMAADEAAAAATDDGEGDLLLAPTPFPERFERRPDVVILSMSAQDALSVKFALETGIDVDLVLRAQGDDTVFATTSVTLPQIVNQGFLIIPDVGDFTLEPPINEIEIPSLPPEPPG